jgi:hypothetical protein
MQWFMPIIPTAWEAEIRRIVVLRQPRKKVSEMSSPSTSQVW